MVRPSPVHQWNGRFTLFPTVCGSYLEIESPTNSMDYKYLIWIRGCWFINGKSLVCDTPHNCTHSKRSREQTDHIVCHGVIADKRWWVIGLWHASLVRAVNGAREQTDHVQRARARARFFSSANEDCISANHMARILIWRRISLTSRKHLQYVYAHVHVRTMCLKYAAIWLAEILGDGNPRLQKKKIAARAQLGRPRR